MKGFAEIALNNLVNNSVRRYVNQFDLSALYA